MRYLPVEGNSDLVKDTRTGAILNVSNNIQVARQAKERRKQSEQDLQEMKQEVQELKSLLSDLLQRLDK